MLHFATYHLRMGSIDGLIRSFDESLVSPDNLRAAFETGLDIRRNLQKINGELKKDIQKCKNDLYSTEEALISLLKLQREVSERIERVSNKILDIDNRVAA